MTESAPLGAPSTEPSAASAISTPDTSDPVVRGAVIYGYLAAKAQASRLLRKTAEAQQHEGTYDGMCRAASLIDRMEPDGV